MNITSLVSFKIDIPDAVEDSWYARKVLVGLKEAAFKSSSPPRHIAELYNTLVMQGLEMNPVMSFYTDCGPDSRPTYLSVQLSLMSLLTSLTDFLRACHSAPFHSWRNPVEQIMATLNLGFQSIDLMRKQVKYELEFVILKCNNTKQLRAAAAKQPALVDAVIESMSPVKILISDTNHRLTLTGKLSKVFPAASVQEVEDVLDSLHSINSTLKVGAKHQKGSLSSPPLLCDFLSHFCQQRRYSFCAKECGSTSCDICKPPRLPSQVFSKIHQLPDPIPAVDGHYKSFSDTQGNNHWNASSVVIKASWKGQDIPVSSQCSAHKQCVPNVSVREVSDVAPLVFTSKALLCWETRTHYYSGRLHFHICCSTFSDLELPSILSEVCFHDIQCYDPVEKLYIPWSTIKFVSFVVLPTTLCLQKGVILSVKCANINLLYKGELDCYCFWCQCHCLLIPYCVFAERLRMWHNYCCVMTAKECLYRRLPVKQY